MERKDSNGNNQRQPHPNYYNPAYGNIPMEMSMPGSNYYQPYYQEMMFSQNYLPPYANSANPNNHLYPQFPINMNYSNTPLLPPSMSYSNANYLPPTNYFNNNPYQISQNQNVPSNPSGNSGYQFPRYLPPPDIYKMYYEKVRMDIDQRKPQQVRYNPLQNQSRHPSTKQKEGYLQSQRQNLIFKTNINPSTQNNISNHKSSLERTNSIDQNKFRSHSIRSQQKQHKNAPQGKQFQIRRTMDQKPIQRFFKQNSFKHQRQIKQRGQKTKKMAQIIVLDSDQQNNQKESQQQFNLDHNQAIQKKYKTLQQDRHKREINNNQDQYSNSKNAEERKKPIQKFLEENNNSSYWKIQKQVRDRKTIKQQKRYRKLIQKQRQIQKMLQKDYKQYLNRKGINKQSNSFQKNAYKDGQQFNRKKQQYQSFKQKWSELRITRQIQATKQKQRLRSVTLTQQDAVMRDAQKDKQMKITQRTMQQVHNLKQRLQKQLDKSRRKGQNLNIFRLQLQNQTKNLLKYHQEKGKVLFNNQAKQSAFIILKQKFRLNMMSPKKFFFTFQQGVQIFQMLHDKYPQFFKTKNPFQFQYTEAYYDKYGSIKRQQSKTKINDALLNKKIQNKNSQRSQVNKSVKIDSQYYGGRQKSKQAIRKQQYFIQKLQGLHDNKMEIQRNLKIVKQQAQLAKQLKNNQSHGKIRKGKQYFQWFTDQNLENTVQKSVYLAKEQSQKQRVFLTLSQKLKFKKEKLLQRKIGLMSF